jgi:hypothetical protein
VKVGLMQKTCPICDGTEHYGLLHTGKITGIEAVFDWNCSCRYYRSYWRIWGDKNIVPPHFETACLSDLKPSSLNKMTIKAQQEIITLVKAFPQDSYFIHGPAGTGKTYLSMCLLENAVANRAMGLFEKRKGATPERTIFRVSTKTWVDDMYNWKYQPFGNNDDRIEIPALNQDRIRSLAKANPGAHICVIFDEIDKFGPTDARLLELFEITNALSEVDAQMITTSNLSPDELIRRWKSPHAEPILRRFYDSTGGQRRRLVHCMLPRGEK